MIGKEWFQMGRWWALLVITFGLSGCGLEYQAGARLAGQECYGPQDCAEGLACVERRCRPELGSGVELDGEGDLAGEDGDREGDEDIADGDGDPDGEEGPLCTAGATRCGPGETIEFCLGDRWDLVGDCLDGEICRDASCVSVDTDPGEEESECCPGGCGSGQICSGCVCESFDRSVCQFQDQPCAVEGQITNGYICSNWGADLQLRCYGICNPEAEEPDQSCPGTTDTICLSEENGPNGYCVSACKADQPCADDQLRCIYYDVGPGDGVCMPTSGSGGPGDGCDGNDFFSCGGQSFCVDGVCAQSCRPFQGGTTDCQSGSFCLAFDALIGACAPSTETSAGSCTQIFTTCQGDATGCFPAPNSSQPVCYEFCRLALGNQDCSGGRQCFQHDGENDQLGICF